MPALNFKFSQIKYPTCHFKPAHFFFCYSCGYIKCAVIDVSHIADFPIIKQFKSHPHKKTRK